MPLRVAVGQIAHETNVFSATPTDYAAFEASGLMVGPKGLTRARGTNSELGGFLAGAEEHGFRLLPTVAVWATPSGTVTRNAIELLTARYERALVGATEGGPVDGVLLALHGAMVTEVDNDGEGLVLELTRATVGPTVPIVATLDLHANISDRMVRLADVLIGYDTYPHVDMAERGQEACGVLLRLMRGEVQPRAALRKPPMLPTSQRMTTDRSPMRDLIGHAHRLEADARVLNVSIAGGFPPSDTADAGVSILVTTDDNQKLADRLADELASAIWDRREGFLGGVSSFEEAACGIHDADVARPLVLVDIADNPWTGGPGDSAELVRFLTAQRVEGAAVALVKDAEAVRAATSAGIGKTVNVDLGGKTDRLHGDPLPVRAEVRFLGDGRFRNDGAMMTGLTVDLGPSAVLLCRPPHDETAPGVEVLVTTRAETPIDLNVFRAHGIEPTRKRVLALKGKGHFRAAFEPIASRVLLVEGPGITGADLSRLPFRKIRRPIWPLDEIDADGVARSPAAESHGP